jgi:hypothetical protein
MVRVMPTSAQEVISPNERTSSHARMGEVGCVQGAELRSGTTMCGVWARLQPRTGRVAEGDLGFGQVHAHTHATHHGGAVAASIALSSAHGGIVVRVGAAGAGRPSGKQLVVQLSQSASYSAIQLATTASSNVHNVNINIVVRHHMSNPNRPRPTTPAHYRAPNAKEMSPSQAEPRPDP